MTNDNTTNPAAAPAAPTATPTPPPTPAEGPGVVTPDRIHLEASVIEIATYLSNIRSPQIHDTRVPFTIVPEGLKVLNLESHMPMPSRVRKDINFIDSKSFLDYFNLFKDGYKPRLFTAGNSAGMSILAVMDYDGPGTLIPAEGPPKTSAPQPMWGEHKARLALSYHPDYATLKASNGSWFKQQEFALFVEENLHLFTSPDAATMLELAQELKGKRNVGWQRGQRLSSGANRLEFIEQVEARSVRGEVEVPEYLLMKTPIFEGYSEQEIKAAFSWKMEEDGKVLFSYRLLTKLAERMAVDEVKAEIAAQTGLPLYAVSTYEGVIGCVPDGDDD